MDAEEKELIKTRIGQILVFFGLLWVLQTFF